MMLKAFCHCVPSPHAGWRGNDLSLGRVVATLSFARRIVRERTRAGERKVGVNRNQRGSREAQGGGGRKRERGTREGGENLAWPCTSPAL